MPLKDCTRIKILSTVTALEKLATELEALIEDTRRRRADIRTLGAIILQVEYVRAQISRLRHLAMSERVPKTLRDKIRSIERIPELGDFARTFKEFIRAEHAKMLKKSLAVIQHNPAAEMRLPLNILREYVRFDYGPAFGAIREKIAERSVKAEDVRIADVGCGIGIVSLELACELPVRISGFDINKRFVGYANRLKSRIGDGLKGDVTFETCDVTRGIPGKYNIVLCNDLLDRSIHAHRIIKAIVNALEKPIEQVIVAVRCSKDWARLEKVVDEFEKYGFTLQHAECRLFTKIGNERVFFVFGRQKSAKIFLHHQRVLLQPRALAD